MITRNIFRGVNSHTYGTDEGSFCAAAVVQVTEELRAIVAAEKYDALSFHVSAHYYRRQVSLTEMRHYIVILIRGPLTEEIFAALCRRVDDPVLAFVACSANIYAWEITLTVSSRRWGEKL